MKDVSKLGSYTWISICENLILITTIVLAVAFFIMGITFSVVFDIAWMFLPVFIGGALICLANYFFGMLLLSVFHNIYRIKMNTEKQSSQESGNMFKNMNKIITPKPSAPPTVTQNKGLQSVNNNTPQATQAQSTEVKKTSYTERSVICPSCLAKNSSTATVCKECGCPLK